MKYFIAPEPFKKVVRVDDDGTVWWLGAGEHDAGYLAWLAEGNTPEPWEAD